MPNPPCEAASFPRRQERGARSVHLRLPADQLAGVDDWAEGQDDKPGRPEAIRRLVAIALKTGGRRLGDSSPEGANS